MLIARTLSRRQRSQTLTFSLLLIVCAHGIVSFLINSYLKNMLSIIHRHLRRVSSFGFSSDVIPVYADQIKTINLPASNELAARIVSAQSID
jgi:hypothetical protein